MSRRSVTRAVCAPLAIAIVTTAIPPAIYNSSAISQWTGKTMTAALAVTGEGMGRLGAKLDTHTQEGTAKISQAREHLAAQLSAAADSVTASVETTYTRTANNVSSGVNAILAQTADAIASGADAISSGANTAIAYAADAVSSGADVVSSGTDAALARVSALMGSVSESVIAMLPSRSEDPAPVTALPVAADAPAADDLRQTASLSTVTEAQETSLPARIDIAPPVASVEVAPAEQAIAPSVMAEPPAPPVALQEAARETEPVSVPAEKIVVAALSLPEPEAVARIPAAPAEAQIEAKAPSTEVIAAVAEKPEAVAEKPEAVTERATAIEVKTVTVEKPLTAADVKTPAGETIGTKANEDKTEQNIVVASLGNPDGMTDVLPTPASAPELAVEFKAPTQKAEEKLVVASLGNPAVETQPAPSTIGVKTAPESSSLLDSVPSSPEDRGHVIDPLQLTNVPMSSPLTMRPLTRADLPNPEKLASLGPSGKSDTRKLPPEAQRVAYDAPIETETPISIGRRRWTEEAAKYQGLGSPEALLEALKHMGAGAKSLGLPASLWCADFMNLVLRKSGIPATGSRAAKSYLQYGQKIDEPRVGAIAIFSRGSNSGHVGIVRGTDGNGNPIIVSGNHNHKVAEATYPKGRVIAYVVPK